MKVWLSIAELAARWGTTEQAIYNMRHRGQGPPSAMIGRRGMYRLTDVVRWEDEQVALSARAS